MTRREELPVALSQDFEIFFDNHPLPMWVLEPASLSILAVNRAACVLYGYDKTEFLALHLSDLQSSSNNLLLETQDSLQPAEARHIRKDGRLLHVEVYSNWVELNQRRALMLTIRELSAPEPAAKTLQEAEAHYHKLAQASPDVIGIVDLRGIITYVSPRAIKQFGLECEGEMVGTNLLDWVAPEWYEIFLGEFQMAIRGEIPPHNEYVLLRKDRSRFWGEFNSELLVDPDGKLYGLLSIVRDVTDRKLIEETVRINMERLEKAERLAQVGHYELDLATNRLTFSKEILLIIDQPESLAPIDVKDCIHYIHADDLEKVKAIFAASRRDHSSFDATFRIVRQDKQVRYIHNHAEFVTQAIVATPKLFGTVQDVTEMRQYDEALRESEERYRAAFERAALGVCEVLIDGRFIKVNQGFCDIVGYTANELLTLTISDVTYPGDSFEDYELALEVLAGKRSTYKVQKRYLHKNGSMVWGNLTVSLITNDLGEPKYFIGVVEDISEQKLAEEKLQRRVLELEALHDIGIALNSSLDPHMIGSKIIEVLEQRLDWHHAAVYLRRENSDIVDQLAFSQVENGDPDASVRASTLINSVYRGMSGWVIKNGQALRVSPVEKDPRYIRVYPGMKSGLYVPLLINDHCIGCISVESYEADAFSEQDERLLLTLSSQAAAALENARLYQQKNTSSRRRDVLYRASQDIALATQNIEDLYAAIHQAAIELIPADVFIINLIDDSRQEVRGVYLVESGCRLPETRFPVVKSLTGLVFNTGRSVRIGDFNQQPNFANAPLADAKITARSILAVPLRFASETIGAISIQSYLPEAYNQDDQDLLEMLASYASAALRNAQLFEQTGLRLQELSTISKVSNAIRGTEKRSEIIAVVLKQITGLLHAEHACLVSLDTQTGEHLVELGLGDWAAATGQRIPRGKGIVSQIASNRQTFIAADMRNEENLYFKNLFQRIRSAVGMPLLVRDEYIASLWVGREESNGRLFSSMEISLLTSVANITANALHRVDLHQQALTHSAQMVTINELGRTLATTNDLGSMYQHLSLSMERLLPDISGIYISEINKKHKKFRCASAYQDGKFIEPAALQDCIHTPQDEDYLEQVGRTGKPGLPDGEASSALYIPMITRDEVIGVVKVQRTAQALFVEEDISVLSLAANTAAIEIQNASLLDDSQRRAAQLVQINEMGRTLADNSSQQEIFSRLAHIGLGLVPGSASIFISLYDDVTRKIQAAFSIHDGEVMDVSAYPQIDLLPPGKGTQSECIHTGKPIIFNDLQKFFRDNQIQVTYAGTDGPVTQSSLCVPMAAHGKTIGVVQLQSYDLGYYTLDDAELLGLVANTAAVTIENLRLYDEVVGHAQRLAQLNNFGSELAASLNLPTIYSTTHNHIHKFFHCQHFCISLLDSEPNTLKAVYFVQNGVEAPVEQFSLTNPAKDQENRLKAMQAGRPQISAAPNDDPDETRPSLLYAPILVEGRPIGLLELKTEASIVYHKDAIEFMITITNQVGLAIQNAQMFAQIEQQLERLSSLRTIDAAISSNTNLNTTLSIILDQVRSQVGVDAADILLINPQTMLFEFAEGRGFRSKEIEKTISFLGRSDVSRAILENRTIFVQNITESPNFTRKNLASMEQFISHCVCPLTSKGKTLGVLEVFNRSPLQNRHEWITFMEMLANEAAIAIDNIHMFQELQHSNMELMMAYDATIEGWAQALDLRDSETEGHSRRVVELAMKLARAMDLHGEELVHLRRGGILHDIGKMGVPDSILRKDGPLTAEEWVIMRQHPVLAHTLLSRVPYLRQALDIPYSHHEKWDGSGYPRGLKGEQIPLGARIFALADVYDALSNDRPYRKALPKQEALQYIREQRGQHFDPTLTDVFLQMLENE